MEIDSSRAGAPKRAPLTQDERDRRHREGLCLYCGQGKHLATNCPNMSTRAKQKFQAHAAQSTGRKA
jgi:hypothetical protein